MPAFASRADGLAIGSRSNYRSMPSGRREAESPLDAEKARTGARLTAADAFKLRAVSRRRPRAGSDGAVRRTGNKFCARARARAAGMVRALARQSAARFRPVRRCQVHRQRGRSTQTTVLGGDAHAQWAAIYEYLRSFKISAAGDFTD